MIRFLNGHSCHIGATKRYPSHLLRIPLHTLRHCSGGRSQHNATIMAERKEERGLCEYGPDVRCATVHMCDKWMQGVRCMERLGYDIFSAPSISSAPLYSWFVFTLN